MGVSDVAPGWQALVQNFLASESGKQLSAQLQIQLAEDAVIYPPQPLRALQLTPPENVRVVILGQDPYHGPGQANGLAFAVTPGVPPPPSLRNICAELEREYGQAPRVEGLLDRWAAQGVLLLNTSLTVRQGQAGSHTQLGWQTLTSAVFARLLTLQRPLVFLLWGRHAQAMRPNVLSAQRHTWLSANHPSPLSARRLPEPFIGCGHFRRANECLKNTGQTPIDWLN